MQSEETAKGQVSDLGKTIENNCGIEFIFMAKTPDEIKHVQAIGGETVHLLTSYEVTTKRSPDTATVSWTDNSGMRRERKIRTATHSAQASVRVQEFLAERYTTNEINRISIDPDVRSFSAHTTRTTSSVRNTIRMLYHVDLATYEKRQHMPWPKGNEDTILSSPTTSNTSHRRPTTSRRRYTPRRRNRGSESL